MPKKTVHTSTYTEMTPKQDDEIQIEGVGTLRRVSVGFYELVEEACLGQFAEEADHA